MNEKFTAIIAEEGISLYRLAKETGIPYTTLNELYNGKKDINNCAAETVYKLSAYLERSFEDLLNDVCLFDGYSGKYKGYTYLWKYEASNVVLYIKKNGAYEEIHREKWIYVPVHPRKLREMLTETIIDAYDHKQKVEEELCRLTI